MTDEELRDKKFNHVLDRYLQTGTMTAFDYENLTSYQRDIIQCIKRAFARINKRWKQSIWRERNMLRYQHE